MKAEPRARPAVAGWSVVFMVGSPGRVSFQRMSAAYLRVSHGPSRERTYTMRCTTYMPRNLRLLQGCMKSPAIWSLLMLPLLALGAETTKQDFSKVMALKPDEERGGQLFEACAACHNTDGGGTTNGSVP